MLSALHDRLIGAVLAVLNLLAPHEVRVDRDRAYAAGENHTADIYRPSAAAPSPVVVFLYGGGWRSGAKDGFAYLGAAFARRGFVTVIPEYRHFPAASLSEILTDNAAAVSWTLAHAGEFGGDPRRVVLVGHSSGAWAAAMLGLDPAWLGRAGTSPDALAGIVGLAGPYEVSALTDPRDLQVFAGSDPALQPVQHAAGPHPALFLLTGADDLDVKPAGTAALARRLREAGDPPQVQVYPGLGHVQIALALTFPFSLQSAVMDDVARFVAEAHAKP